MDRVVQLSQGDGGIYSNKLIKETVFKYFKPRGNSLDSAVANCDNKEICVTTNSYVVNPLFFPGGNIGSLGIINTMNNLIVSGAKPKYISVSLIIEEEFPLDMLNDILHSIRKICDKSKIEILCGDTKVVNIGKVDGLYINISAIGEYIWKQKSNINIRTGDEVIVTGSIAEHGFVIASKRFCFDIESSIESDLQPIDSLLDILDEYSDKIIIMRDLSRGGLGTILNDCCNRYNCSIMLNEECIPIKDEIRNKTCFLGLNPYYLNSGNKLIIIANKGCGEGIISKLNKTSKFENASIIGEVINREEHKLFVKKHKEEKPKILKPLELNVVSRLC